MLWIVLVVVTFGKLSHVKPSIETCTLYAVIGVPLALGAVHVNVMSLLCVLLELTAAVPAKVVIASGTPIVVVRTDVAEVPSPSPLMADTLW